MRRDLGEADRSPPPGFTSSIRVPARRASWEAARRCDGARSRSTNTGRSSRAAGTSAPRSRAAAAVLDALLGNQRSRAPRVWPAFGHLPYMILPAASAMSIAPHDGGRLAPSSADGREVLGRRAHRIAPDRRGPAKAGGRAATRVRARSGRHSRSKAAPDRNVARRGGGNSPVAARLPTSSRGCGCRRRARRRSGPPRGRSGNSTAPRRPPHPGPGTSRASAPAGTTRSSRGAAGASSGAGDGAHGWRLPVRERFPAAASLRPRAPGNPHPRHRKALGSPSATSIQGRRVRQGVRGMWGRKWSRGRGAGVRTLREAAERLARNP